MSRKETTLPCGVSELLDVDAVIARDVAVEVGEERERERWSAVLRVAVLGPEAAAWPRRLKPREVCVHRVHRRAEHLCSERAELAHAIREGQNFRRTHKSAKWSLIKVVIAIYDHIWKSKQAYKSRG